MSEKDVEPTTSGATEELSQNRKETNAICLQASNLAKAANGLPKQGDDFELCNSFSMFNQFMSQEELRIKRMMTKIMTVGGCSVRPPKQVTGIDSYLEKIIAANDGLLERASVVMDELERAGRDEEVAVPKVIIGAESTKRDAGAPRQLTVNSSSPAMFVMDRFKIAHEERESMKASNAVSAIKPQKQYNLHQFIDNSHTLFVCKLKETVNKRDPKQSSMTLVEVNEPRSLWRSEDFSDAHPYRVELEHFNPPKEQMEPSEVQTPRPLEDTPLTFVDSLEELKKMCQVLKKSRIFAVDLEHHSTRSFLGLTCLIQISTRDHDFIIDPFPIWSDMHLLNDSFTDPNILKVFHGAESDVLWLQRDFGVYIVNMFDTYCAMRRLELPKFSLQYLVQIYCGVHLDKTFQTCDWRVRPLSEQHLQYARGDTHYLLACYDHVQQALLQKGNEFKNLLVAVYNDSKAVCGKVFEKPEFEPLGYERMLGNKRGFNSRQIYALSELWKWRDSIARKEDESLHFVLPDHMMLHIAESLPREMQGITACCSPVPIMVKTYLIDLHRIVFAARDRPLERTYADQKTVEGKEQSILQTLIDQQNRMTKQKSLLRCKIDFSHSRFDEEVGNILKNLANCDISLKEDKDSFLSVLTDIAHEFSTDSETTNKEKRQEILKKLQNWAAPYECFQLAVKEAAKREKERAEQEKLAKKDESGVKTTFTHHDACVSRLPVVDPETVNENDISLFDVANPTEVYTKKAQKRARKVAREGADIRTDLPDKPPMDVDAVPETPSYSFKRIKDDVDEPRSKKPNTKKEEPEDDAVVVDYSSYDKSMFEQQPSSSSGIDPFHQQFTLGNKKNNNRRRGRGGHHRMGTMSTGYKPDNNKK